MTLSEYEQGYCEGSDDVSGPAIDPLENAMVEHLVEYETEMFRLDCRRRFASCDYKLLEKLLINLHGKDWRDAL